MRRVHQAHGERPGEELAGVRVAGELQVEAGPRAERRELWIVGEQQLEVCGFADRDLGAQARIRRVDDTTHQEARVPLTHHFG